MRSCTSEPSSIPRLSAGRGLLLGEDTGSMPRRAGRAGGIARNALLRHYRRRGADPAEDIAISSAATTLLAVPREH